MFRNLQVEKTETGEYHVSFLTDHPAMRQFIRFFRVAAEEADYFYHKTLMAIRTADLGSRKPDPRKAEEARWERKKIFKKYHELKGSRRERYNALRRFLIEEGRPVSYDGLNYILRLAAEENRQEKSAKIEELIDRGIPYRAIARQFGMTANSVILLAKKAGIHVDGTALEENLAITIEKLHREGLSPKQISNQLGVALSMVCRIAKQAGIAQAYSRLRSRVPFREKKENRAALITALAAKGVSIRDISRRLKINYATAYRYAKRLKILKPVMLRASRLSKEIEELAAKGLSPKDISKRLRIPAATVWKHPAWAAHSQSKRGQVLMDVGGELENSETGNIDIPLEAQGNGR
jgi:hypothetical protein